MLLAVSSATEGLIHEIQQWEGVVGIQPACLNRYPVSAVGVLVGGSEKTKEPRLTNLWLKMNPQLSTNTSKYKLGKTCAVPASCQGHIVGMFWED